MTEVSAGLAFLAGLASFLSPCVFGLIPAYVGYLSGRSVARIQQEGVPNRLETFLHGVAFVFGFSLVFLTLGLALSAVGSLLYDLRVWIARLGGIIVILLGLHMTGLLRLQWLEYDLRPRTPLDQRRSLFSSAFLGISFSAGWSPCIGPVLGMILTLAINQGSVANGLFLLAMYSLGLAIPFLVAALGIGWVVTILRRYRKVIHYVEIAMGVIMIGVGVLLFLGIFNQLAQFGFFVDLGL